MPTRVPFRRVRMSSAACLLAFVVLLEGTASAETFRPFKLKALEGTERSFSDLQGKATLVAFFYPSCKFCNAAFPEIQKLYDTYKDRGLSVVWINILPEEERLIADWRTKHGYTVPILVGGRSVQNDYRLTMTPTHYVIDAEGKVLKRYVGYKAGDETKIEKIIQQALAK